MDTLQCKTCRTTVLPRLAWVGPHVRASCPGCGAYIRFVTQTAEVLALVGPRPVRPTTGDLFRDDLDERPELPGADETPPEADVAGLYRDEGDGPVG